MSDTVYGRSESFVERRIARDTILVPIAHNVADLECLFTLNEVAGRIWSLLDGRTSVEQIVRQISSEYKITPELALEDTLNFIESLRNAHLIQSIDPEGTR